MWNGSSMTNIWTLKHLKLKRKYISILFSTMEMQCRFYLCCKYLLTNNLMCINRSESESEVRCNSAEKAHSGVYQITATNKIAKKSAEIAVNVIGELFVDYRKILLDYRNNIRSK